MENKLKDIKDTLINTIQSHTGPTYGFSTMILDKESLEQIVEALNNNPRITHLELRHNNFTQSNISPLTKLKHITGLSFGQCDVTNKMLAILLQSGTSLRENLEYLDLTRNRCLNDKSAEILKQLPKMKNLWLIESGITDQTREEILNYLEQKNNPQSSTEDSDQSSTQPSTEKFDQFHTWQRRKEEKTTLKPSYPSDIPSYMQPFFQALYGDYENLRSTSPSTTKRTTVPCHS